MTDVCHEVITPYTHQQIFDLVNDVESYHLFIPWCYDSVLEEQRHDHSIVATLYIQNKGIKVSFTTLNRVTPDGGIIMELVSGPFQHLQGEWKFIPLGADGCKIVFCLNYEFSNRAYAVLLSSIFEKITNSIVSAFLERAKQVYG